METPAHTERVLSGQPASPGHALGPVVRLAAQEVLARTAGTQAEERKALEDAVAKAIGEIDALVASASGPAADMLEFQSAMLADESLRDPALVAIAEGRPADAAWSAALGDQITEYQSASDEYFRARAADLGDLRDRVLRRLAGQSVAQTILPGSIVAADELTPSQFLEADWSQGGAIMLAAGSASSHVAMLARARGVPMVVGFADLPLEGHTTALIDGALGRVVLSPGAAELSRFALDQAAANDRRDVEQLALISAARTRDGALISVLVNISGPDDLKSIDPATCDGIGLFRTELMFRDGGPLPDENQQYNAYRRCLEWAGGKPVTIRTLDIGGDKPVRGLTPAGESNPFLGSRGIRLMLARSDVFSVQLRALARAASHGALKVMLPMVTLPSELAAASRLLDQAVADLTREGTPCRRPPLGIMIEVPAAAIMAARFYEAAFFSIGSNDLTQYVMAASRDTPAVASLNEGAPEAVLHLMAGTVAAAKTLGIDVSLCGDLAGDSRVLVPLLATGLRSFSVAPVALGRVKHALSGLILGGGDGQT